MRPSAEASSTPSRLFILHPSSFILSPSGRFRLRQARFRQPSFRLFQTTKSSNGIREARHLFRHSAHLVRRGVADDNRTTPGDVFPAPLLIEDPDKLLDVVRRGRSIDPATIKKDREMGLESRMHEQPRHHFPPFPHRRLGVIRYRGGASRLIDVIRKRCCHVVGWMLTGEWNGSFAATGVAEPKKNQKRRLRTLQKPLPCQREGEGPRIAVSATSRSPWQQRWTDMNPFPKEPDPP